MCLMCNKPVYCKGLCSYHYHEHRPSGVPCTAPDCKKFAVSKGLCAMHYRQKRKGTSSKPCKADLCMEPSWALNLCRKHYQQHKRGILTKHHRLLPNTVLESLEAAIIQLRNNAGDVIAEVLIDLEDLPKCSAFKWGLRGGYASNSKCGDLHRFVVEAKEGDLVDHINQDKLDNRRKNLRLTTKSVNSQNSKMLTSNTSGFRGVYFNKPGGNWIANIRIKGKTLNLGGFPTAQQAADAYDKAALLYFGPCARFNADAATTKSGENL